MKKPTDSIETIGRFDYVIVGGGSAGCVLANRLSENPANRVCLFEAGGAGKNPLITMPMGFSVLAMLPGDWYGLNWRFDTTPQAQLNNRNGFQPRGRGLGGSSAINAMIYIRGSKQDYDRWAALGADGWAWDDVFPYFLKSEDNERGENDYHRRGGELAVSDLRYNNPLSDIFLTAAQSIQYPMNEDFNGARQEGLGYYQVTQKNGQRWSSAAAFLEPVKQRANLEVITNAHVEKALFVEHRVQSVVFREGRRRKKVDVDREAIFSAGAFQSPQLLMLSGIGPHKHLSDHNVPVLYDSPEVGHNLQDHLDYALIYRSSSPHSVGMTANALLSLPNDFQNYRKNGQGALTSNLAECGGFLKTDPSLSDPDIQLHFLPCIVDDHGRKKHFGGGFSCHVCVLRPKSKGAVRLHSNDPKAPPLIDPNFLHDEDDLIRLKNGARIAERIMAAPVLREVKGKRLYIDDNANDEALIADIRNRADTIYHPVGTCRMGNDETAVLDPQLRVRGVKGLRVVDASVMPALISGNTNAPSMMVAEKAADLIKQA